MDKINLGFALCGSFCTFDKAIAELTSFKESEKYNLFPIMSFNAYNLDTRFGKAADFIEKIEKICGKEIIHSIQMAEPLGPEKIVDVLLIEPCTGNTLAKLANGITDTPVTMSAKSVLRIGTPVVLGIATNDALSASAQNIGRLINVKNIYFVPVAQDSPEKKPNSAVCNFSLTNKTVEKALLGKQIEPVLL